MFRRRLSTSSSVFFGLSVAAGIHAFLLMRSYARRLETTRPDVGSPVNVVVARAAIARGVPVTTDVVRTDRMPSAFVPPGAVQVVDDIVGRVLSADVVAGEVLIEARLAGASSGPVAALVPAGLRAFVIPSGLPPESVRAGDRIDVLAAFAGGRPHVETVAAGVEVSQVVAAAGGGGVADVVAPSGASLVLLVDPETAERLTYAVTFAKLTVTVEPPGDNDFFTSARDGTG